MASISPLRSRMAPVLPTPAGMSANSASASRCCSGITSARVSPVCRQRTPQEMSKPTPPADTTPPSSASKAATPPIGKP
jgi:hypothetical protein